MAKTTKKIIIYNPNSTGGNFDYAMRITKSLVSIARCDVILLLPKNASTDELPFVRKILWKDRIESSNRLFNRVYFAGRSLVNPFILFFFILSQNSSRIIFNDYDQLSAFFWAPFFLLIRGKRKFSVILHDPDRDGYFSSRILSETTMKAVMTLMSKAFYHEILPQRSYYREAHVRFISIPHGIYERRKDADDQQLFHQLAAFRGKDVLYGVVGNIRAEKNYELVLKALSRSQGKLVIAGSPSSGGVSTSEIRALGDSLAIANRVLWIEKYLGEKELHTVIKACDVIVLYYKKTFHSQSGILNVIAPYKKELIVSDTPSALAAIVKRFDLGTLVPPDDEESLRSAMQKKEKNISSPAGWDHYLEYASWEKAAGIIKHELIDEG